MLVTLRRSSQMHMDVSMYRGLPETRDSEVLGCLCRFDIRIDTIAVV